VRPSTFRPRPALLPAEPALPVPDRPLTHGERAICELVFGAALDPEPVTIRCRKWAMWQPAWVTMAPDGHLWFHPNGGRYRADFASASPEAQHLFVHEMVHVWQVQQGIDLPLARHPLSRYAYLPLRKDRPFARMGLEQQAELVADAWAAGIGAPRAARPPLAELVAQIPFWNAGSHVLPGRCPHPKD
jgi:hypothetical protein